MMPVFGSMLGVPRRVSSTVNGEEPPDIGSSDYGSMLDLGGQPQPSRPTFGQAFRAGYDQTSGPIGRKLRGGLAGYAGGGGFLGGLGKVASFMI